MTRLDKALQLLNQWEGAPAEERFPYSLPPRIKVGVTLLFLLAVLSVPMRSPGGLHWFFVYPVVTLLQSGIPRGRFWLQSLTVVPLLLCIGLPNLFYHDGWVLLYSLLLRGLLCFQALLLLIQTTGFYPLCRSMGQGRLVGLLATQCLLVYRYIGVLLKEVQRMLRAYRARSYGRRSIPVRQWGAMTGHLLLRSLERSERIHRAMKARGFQGTFPAPPAPRIRPKEWLYLFGWGAAFLLLRMIQ
jgi:cobalt/nickel transport system permease protein